MDTEVVAERLVGYGSPLCGGWDVMPEEARAAAFSFVALLRSEPDLRDVEDWTFEVAEGACPIYYSDQYALLADADSRHWLERWAEDYEVCIALADLKMSHLTVYQLSCREASRMFVNAVERLLAGIVSDLQDGTDGDAESGEGWAAFGLSPDEVEVACALFSDGWSGSLDDLLAASRRLEVAK